MKILVTGSNGLLGFKLTELFLNKNVDFVATSRGQNRNTASGPHTYYPMDIEIPSQIEEVMSSVKPDVIINAAAMTQVDDCELDRKRC